MRYAMPMSNGMLSPHFGHCDQFALIDVDEVSKKITHKQFESSPEHQPGLLPKWLSERGVHVVIAGSMGSRARELFRQNRIRVVFNTLERDPEKALSDYLQGVLEVGTNICDH
jgi:predicted Fe-Mo cluster-binding NifX family protein